MTYHGKELHLFEMVERANENIMNKKTSIYYKTVEVWKITEQWLLDMTLCN